MNNKLLVAIFAAAILGQELLGIRQPGESITPRDRWKSGGAAVVAANSFAQAGRKRAGDRSAAEADLDVKTRRAQEANEAKLAAEKRVIDAKQQRVPLEKRVELMGASTEAGIASQNATSERITAESRLRMLQPMAPVQPARRPAWADQPSSTEEVAGIFSSPTSPAPMLRRGEDYGSSSNFVYERAGLSEAPPGVRRRVFTGAYRMPGSNR